MCQVLGSMFCANCLISWGFPGGSVVMNLPANAGDLGSIPGWGRSLGEGNGNLLQYSCLGNPIDRSLAGYSPWGRKESDTTEHTHTDTHVSFNPHITPHEVCHPIFLRRK